MDIFLSIFKASLTGAMMFISIVRLGMIAYPVVPEVEYTVAPDISLEEADVIQSQVVSPATKRRILLNQNSIENLGKSN